MKKPLLKSQEKEKKMIDPSSSEEESDEDHHHGSGKHSHKHSSSHQSNSTSVNPVSHHTNEQQNSHHNNSTPHHGVPGKDVHNSTVAGGQTVNHPIHGGSDTSGSLEVPTNQVPRTLSPSNGVSQETLNQSISSSRANSLPRPTSPSPSIASEKNETDLQEKQEREEEERKRRIQLYVFVSRCISYPFNAKQPTDMTRRQIKITKQQLDTTTARFQVSFFFFVHYFYIYGTLKQ